MLYDRFADAHAGLTTNEQLNHVSSSLGCTQKGSPFRFACLDAVTSRLYGGELADVASLRRGRVLSYITSLLRVLDLDNNFDSSRRGPFRTIDYILPTDKPLKMPPTYVRASIATAFVTMLWG